MGGDERKVSSREGERKTQIGGIAPPLVTQRKLSARSEEVRCRIVSTILQRKQGSA